MSIDIIDDTYIVAVWHILSYTIKCISTQVLAAFNFFTSSERLQAQYNNTE